MCVCVCVCVCVCINVFVCLSTYCYLCKLDHFNVCNAICYVFIVHIFIIISNPSHYTPWALCITLVAVCSSHFCPHIMNLYSVLLYVHLLYPVPLLLFNFFKKWAVPWGGPMFATRTLGLTPRGGVTQLRQQPQLASRVQWPTPHSPPTMVQATQGGHGDLRTT